MKRLVPLFPVLSMLVGCASTQTGQLVIPPPSQQESHFCWITRGGNEVFRLAIDHESGAFDLEPAGGETPTLKQISAFFDQVFAKLLRPKLSETEVPTDVELTLLACCLHVAILQMETMNIQIFNALDFSDSSATHKYIASREPIHNLDLTEHGSPAIKDSEQSFSVLLNQAARDCLRSENVFRKGVDSFGGTFISGRTSLSKEERGAIFASLSGREKFHTFYLKHSWWRNFGTLFLFNDYGASNRPLPEYKKTYNTRLHNLLWLEQYLAASRKFDEMRILIKTNLLATSGVKGKNERRRRDSLLDFSNAIQNEHIGAADAVLIAQEYPFALGMVECMKMMDEYYKYEKLWNTPNAAQRKYKEVAKTLVKLANGLNLDHIENENLRVFYETEYVQFLENVLISHSGKHMTSDELFADNLIPFRKEGAPQK